MTRLGAACLLLTLCACGKERPDPRLAEVTTPLHATVRLIDAPVERTCTGSTWEQVKCMLSPADRQGCVYVEVGAAADKPEVSKTTGFTRCMTMRGSTDRAVLSDAPGRKAKLTFDTEGTRIVVELADAVHALYLRGGHLVIQRKLGDVVAGTASGLLRPDGTADWSRVPPFLAVLDEAQLLALTEEELDALVARTPAGKDALKTSLLNLLDSAGSADTAWSRAVSKLDAADRTRLRDALLIQVSTGSVGALDWFDSHPEEQKADFIEALAESMETELFDVGTGFPRLLRLAPARAETIACAQLERLWHQSSGSEYDSYDSMSPEAAPLAVIVARRSKCPWVLPMLVRNHCAWELQCDPDPDDEKPTPLCTAAQIEAALKRTLQPELELSRPEEVDRENDWGPLLIGAAKVQGPLPPELLRADERRLYAQTFTRSDQADDPCGQLTIEPTDWACKLPTEIHTATTESCTLVLDDAKKTMTLSSPEPEWAPEEKD